MLGRFFLEKHGDTDIICYGMVLHRRDYICQEWVLQHMIC